jgi:RimJ/RimL family protein N-acetyltransferase
VSSTAPRLTTDRLVLRGWGDGDEEAFAAINADPEVARFTNGRPMTREETRVFLERIQDGWDRRGYGLWAVEDVESHAFLGFIGLSHHRWYPDDVEVGWRLARWCWGRGLATEGAAAAVRHAFDEVGLDRVISIIHRDNVASRRVAEKNRFSIWKEAVHPKPGDGTPLPIVVYARGR